MRTTLDLDETLLDAAARATGAPTKTALIELGLRALIAPAARRRLAARHPHGRDSSASAPTEAVKPVDTSVRVDFFRGRARAGHLAHHLEADEVLLHPWVLGELAPSGDPERVVDCRPAWHRRDA